MPDARKLTRAHFLLLLLLLSPVVTAAVNRYLARAPRPHVSLTPVVTTQPKLAASRTPRLSRARFAPAGIVAETEPNNTRATATALSLDGDGFGTGNGALGAGDEDYWLVSAPTNDDAIYALVETGTTANADTTLEVMNADGVILQTDDDDGSSTNCAGVLYSGRSSTVYGVGGGTCGEGGPCAYYLRVKAKNGTDVIPSYKLFVIGAAVANSEAAEPNNTAATASPLVAAGNLIGGSSTAVAGTDLDYFSIVVNAATAGRTLYLSVASDAAPADDDFVLSLIGPNGVTTLFTADSSGIGGESNPPVETFCYQLPGPGTYYARVELNTESFIAPRGNARAVPRLTNLSLLAALLPSSLASADLAVTNTAPATAAAGQNISYAITVQNNGPNAATNVVLTNPLPAGTTFQALVAPAGFTCMTPAVNATGTVTCTASSFANSASASFTLTARVNTNVGCDAAFTNTATVTATTSDPNTVNNSATATTSLGTLSDLALTATGAPAAPLPDTSVTYTLTVTNNGPSPSAATVVTDQLPAAFTAEAATPAAGSCSGVGTNTVTCNLGTLAPSASVKITIRAHVPETCQPANVVNTATVSNSNCLPDPNPANNSATTPTTVQLANIGPGACPPASSGFSGTRPGSLLFAGLFVSSASGGGNLQNNTQVNLTNIHPTLPVVMHLFFVDGETCSIADAFICLTANQTTSFLMSDLDPGTRGYMMMVAVDGPPGFAGGMGTGCPISFNYLIGNARIKFTGSPQRDLDLPTESVPSQFGSPVPNCGPDSSTAVLIFDDSPGGYSRLPGVLALDNIPSRADGNDTVLMLGRVDGNWATGLRPIGNVAGVLYNDTETPFSFSFNAGTCFLRSSLTGSFPRTAPRLEQAIPAGRSGWMRLWSTEGAALIGAMHNRNDNSRSAPNAFEGGHNLHVLRLLPRAVITVPVFPPACAF